MSAVTPHRLVGVPWTRSVGSSPVESVGKPKVGVNASTLSFDVETGKHRGTVKLSYWHGSVKLHEPDWVKKGNQLKVDRGKRAPTRRGPGPMTKRPQ